MIFNEQQKKSEGPEISVVVCTRNRGEKLLLRTLNSLQKQTVDKKKFEIIVVENQSTDGTQTVLNSYNSQGMQFRWVSEQCLGTSYARNRGIKESQGGIIAFLDDDCQASVDWLQSILNCFQNTSPRPILIGGEVVSYDDDGLPKWYSPKFDFVSGHLTPHFLESQKGAKALNGGNMAFRKELVDLIGNFSVELGYFGDRKVYGEDTEFVFRALLFKLPVVCDPQIVVFHYMPASRLKLNYRATRSYGAGRVNAHIERRKLWSKETLAELLKLHVAILKIPYSLIFLKYSPRAVAFLWTSETFFRAGRIAGTIQRVASRALSKKNNFSERLFIKRALPKSIRIPLKKSPMVRELMYQAHRVGLLNTALQFNSKLWLPQYKAIYICQPKVASTSLLNALTPLIGETYRAGRRREIPGCPFFALYREDHFRFAVARNPWDRILSCYINKFSSLHKLGLDLPHYFINNGLFRVDMSFEEFIEIVHRHKDHELDNHLRSQSFFMIDRDGAWLPDFVGRFENLQTDWKYIKKQTGIPQEIELPKQNPSKHDHYRSYYTPKTKELVAQRYARDIERFNYDF